MFGTTDVTVDPRFATQLCIAATTGREPKIEVVLV
jgi:hypothetical protein